MKCWRAVQQHQQIICKVPLGGTSALIIQYSYGTREQPLGYLAELRLNAQMSVFNTLWADAVHRSSSSLYMSSTWHT